MTLNKLIRLLSSDNKYRELQWKEGDLHLDPYRRIEMLYEDYNDSKFQLVLLDPDRFSGQSLTVHNPVTNTKGVYVAGSDGYLRESPGGTDSPAIPTMPFYEGRPRAPHRNNPFYVALSSAFIFLRYQSDSARFNVIPEKTRALLSKTLRVKELLEWKLRTEDGALPPRRPLVGSAIDLSHLTTDKQVEEDLNKQSNTNPIDFYLTKIPDEYLEEYLDTVSQAYMNSREEEDTDSDVSSDADDEDDADGHRGNCMDSNNSEDRQAYITKETKPDGPYSYIRDDKWIEDRYPRKEIMNYQYGVE